MEDILCPWWLAYTFDHRLRRLVHNPEKILGPYVHEGMTAMDIGCGMGFFSISMAKLVGDSGSVIAVDLQQKMLTNLEKRAKRAGVIDRIVRYHCEPENIGDHRNVDFTLTFWMVHEVPNPPKFLTQIYAALKPGGQYLLVEPKIHVAAASFEKTVEIARQVGFKTLETPPVAISRAVLFGKA